MRDVNYSDKVEKTYSAGVLSSLFTSFTIPSAFYIFANYSPAAIAYAVAPLILGLILIVKAQMDALHEDKIFDESTPSSTVVHGSRAR